MVDIPDNNQPIQIEGVELRSPVSESVMQTIGGDINGLLNRMTANEALDAIQSADILTLFGSQVVYQVGSFSPSGSPYDYVTTVGNLQMALLVGQAGGIADISITIKGSASTGFVKTKSAGFTGAVEIVGSSTIRLTGSYSSGTYYFFAFGVA